jgi:hypothetical protein
MIPKPQKRTNCKPLAVVFMNSAGARRTLRFSSEDELIDFMVKTSQTDAPILFEYADGTAVERGAMDRLHERYFALLSTQAMAPGSEG